MAEKLIENFFNDTKVIGGIHWNDMYKNIRTRESEVKRTEIAEVRSFIYLVMLLKLVFRQGNNVYMGILSLLLVKKNSLAMF